MDIKNKDPSTEREGGCPYDARQVANWFINRAKQDNLVLSVMAILKLSYIAHGRHLALYNAPLFKNQIQAWRYGPVIVEVYREFRTQDKAVSKPANGWPKIEASSRAGDLLEKVWKKYGKLHPFKLSFLTHISGGPWDMTYEIGGWYAPIPDKLIKQHYDAIGI